MSEINPNHPVTNEVREQWHKFCAILMFKFGVKEVEITISDLEAFQKQDHTSIAVKPENDTISLILLTNEEAKRLAEKAGGLPI